MSTPFKAGTLIEALKQNHLLRIYQNETFSMLTIKPGSTHLVLRVQYIGSEDCELWELTLLTERGEALCAHSLDSLHRHFRSL